ncbi:ATPase [Acidiplasma sp. MBA-1]|uniref:ATPase n=1 Tax=Acidiplasma aeolicum TaxID=507754 RepID=A0A0Q0VR59_9ARCH|nr:ATPase [Acidiplasma sp. MBA-1]KQB33633.1 ATPase [Acidiplasma aeolicum]
MKAGVRGVQDLEYEIGFTAGKNSSGHFQFVISENADIKKWEYVGLNINGSIVIGRIEDIVSKSDLMDESIDYESIKRYTENKINDSTNMSYVNVLGRLENDNLVQSREIITPGLKVYKLSSGILKKLFSFPDDESLYIGNLPDTGVPVSINIKGMRRHLAILAQTGAGKSHTASVIMEELLKKGASIIVLDPHADYVFMKKDRDGKIYSDNIDVFRTPLSTGRYSRDDIGIIKEFTIRFQDLTADDIKGIMGIKDNYTQMSPLIDDILKAMKGKKDLNDFMNTAEKLPQDDYRKIKGRLVFLEKIREIFSDYTTGIKDYLGPGKMSVLDLSGMDQYLANYFSFRILSEIYDSKISSEFKYPVFIFVEEAHNFVPPRVNSNIAGMIKKIAAEGRKFGIFLTVITQRPGKIDADVLSQCNSQIILRVTNPIDQNAILQSSENITESLMEDLPSLDTGEAIIVGEIVKMPVIIKVRDRETKPGGSDIDIISLLKEARDEVRKMNNPDEIKKKNKNLLGDF